MYLFDVFLQETSAKSHSLVIGVFCSVASNVRTTLHKSEQAPHVLPELSQVPVWTWVGIALYHSP